MYPTLENEDGNVTIGSPLGQFRRGCPTLKYKAFCFPLSNLQNREAPPPSTLLSEVAKGDGFDTDLIVDHLLRVLPPNQLATNLNTLSVFDEKTAVPVPRMGRVALFLNLTDTGLLPQIIPHLEFLAANLTLDVHVTSVHPDAEGLLRNILAGHPMDFRTVDSPVSNIEAMFGYWGDIVRSGQQDLVLCLGGFFYKHNVNYWLENRVSAYYDNLVGGPAALAEVSRLFASQRRVGMVMSPICNFTERLRQSFWGPNRTLCRKMGAELKIKPAFLEEITPYHPIHGQFWLRADVARLLIDSYANAASIAGDGDMGDCFEKIMTAVMAKDGYIAWRVATARNVGLSATALDWMVRDALLKARSDRTRMEKLEKELVAANEAAAEVATALAEATSRLAAAEAAADQAAKNNAALVASHQSATGAQQSVAPERSKSVVSQAESLALAENQTLKRLYLAAMEECRALRRVASVSVIPATPAMLHRDSAGQREFNDQN